MANESFQYWQCHWDVILPDAQDDAPSHGCWVAWAAVCGCESVFARYQQALRKGFESWNLSNRPECQSPPPSYMWVREGRDFGVTHGSSFPQHLKNFRGTSNTLWLLVCNKHVPWGLKLKFLEVGPTLSYSEPKESGSSSGGPLETPQALSYPIWAMVKTSCTKPSSTLIRIPCNPHLTPL